MNIIWALCCFSTGLFCLSLSRLIIASNKNEAWTWNYIMHINAILIPVFFLHFVFHFIGYTKKKIIIFLYLISFFLMGLISSPLFIKDLVPKASFVYWAQIGPLYIGFSLFFLAIVLYAEYLLIKQYKQSSGFARNQIKYLILGSTVGFLGGATNFFLNFDIAIFPFGNYFIVAYVFIISYAMVRYRLMDINLVLHRTVFVVLLGFIFLFYIVVTKVLYPLLGYNLSIVIATITIATLLSLTPSRKKLASLLDKTLYRGAFDYQDILQQAAQQLIRILDMDKLLAYIKRLLVENIHITTIAIFLFDEDESAYRIESYEGLQDHLVSSISLTKDTPLITWLMKNRTIFVKEEQKLKLSKDVLEDLYGNLAAINAEVIIPLLYKEDLIGILSLGLKLREAVYSQRDINILTNLANEASQAIVNAQLYLGAITDGLTKLYHRRYLDIRLDEEVRRAKLFKHPLSFILIDIDHFKELNDIYGHDTGDIVLKNIAKIFSSSIRTVDVLCRYGGEEFAIIACETNLDGAKVFSERLRQIVENYTFKHEKLTLNLTLSIGVTAYREGMHPNELIELADTGLYRAKEEGRNRVCVGEIKI